MSKPSLTRRHAIALRILAIAFCFCLAEVDESRAEAVAAEPADASSAETAATKPAEASEGPIVHAIQWTGVTAFDEDDLEGRIVTSVEPRFRLRFWKPRNRLDEFVLEEDVDRIVEAYAEIGYFEAEASAEVKPLADDRVIVEFEVVEGSAVRLEAWSLEIVSDETGEQRPSQEELQRLRQHVAFDEGVTFGSKLYLERRSALLGTCGEIGFASARISGGADVDPVAETARVSWTLRLGQRASFREIRIIGLETIDEKIVLRELLFEPGDRYSSTKLEASERRLIGTNLFRVATIGAAPAEIEDGSPPLSGNPFDVEIYVEEAAPRSLRASIGYGTEDGPRGQVGLVWRNFTGEARRLDIRAFASFLDAGVESSLEQPYLFGRWSRGNLAVSALRQSRPGYEAFVTGASALLTAYPDRESPFSLTVGPGYELANVTDFEIDVDESLRGPRQSVIVNTFVVGRYQQVDDPLNPTRGLRVQLHNELGGYPIGSDLDYQSWELDLRVYRPMGPFVWAARATARTIDPLGGGIADVPVTRRLYAGGTNSVRGFGFQKLGPTDSGNDPIGGLSRILLGVELRLPEIWRSFGLVGFVDAGDVREGPWSWRPRDLRASAGPGLRLATPVGPLRFDFGFLLNPPPDADPWRFHLSIGQAF